MRLYFIKGNDQADVKQDLLKFDKRKDDNYSRPQVVAIRRATTVQLSHIVLDTTCLM